MQIPGSSCRPPAAPAPALAAGLPLPYPTSTCLPSDPCSSNSLPIRCPPAVSLPARGPGPWPRPSRGTWARGRRGRRRHLRCAGRDLRRRDHAVLRAQLLRPQHWCLPDRRCPRVCPCAGALSSRAVLELDGSAGSTASVLCETLKMQHIPDPLNSRLKLHIPSLLPFATMHQHLPPLLHFHMTLVQDSSGSTWN